MPEYQISYASTKAIAASRSRNVGDRSRVELFDPISGITQNLTREPITSTFAPSVGSLWVTNEPGAALAFTPPEHVGAATPSAQRMSALNRLYPANRVVDASAKS